MTKAYSHAERRRRKRKLAEQFGLAETPKRQKSGRLSQPRAERDAAGADRAALEARARHEGRGTTRQDREAVRTAHSASGVGRAIRATLDPEPAMEAHQTWVHYSAAMRTNRRRVYGTSITAKTADIVTEPEPFQTRDDDRPDDRTEDEKHRDAMNARAKWDRDLAQLRTDQRRLVEQSLYAEDAEWWDTLMHCPTRKGAALARALYDLADVAD